MRRQPIRTEITTGPVSEPVSLQEAKDHLQVIGIDEDALIGTYLAAARRAVERHLSMQLMPATIAFGFDRFPGVQDPMHMAIRPVSAISSITYYDTNNTQQTLSTSLWEFVSATPYGYIVPAWTQLWPETRTMPLAESVTVTATAGYADADAVPEPIKTAIQMLTRDIYDNRVSQTMASEALTHNPNYRALLSLYTVPNA